MIKYRVYTNIGFDEFADLFIAKTYHSEHGIGEIETVTIEESVVVFSLQSWKAEANQLHNQLFESYYKPLQYESEADIALTALNSAQYSLEALSLAKWRNYTYDIIEAVTEAQAKQTSPQDFINSLPVFNV
jgi:hypothetical protein